MQRRVASLLALVGAANGAIAQTADDFRGGWRTDGGEPAALDDIVIAGDTLTFNILHEDWDLGSLLFHNQAAGHFAKNEKRLTFQQNNMPRPAAGAPSFAASLLGPVAIEATRGND